VPTGTRPLLPLLLILLLCPPAAAEPPSATSGKLEVLWDRFETTGFPDLEGRVSVLQGRRDVAGLEPRMFRLIEDGQEQGTLRVVREAEGVVIALLVDTSGSMRESLAAAKGAVQEFVRNLKPEDQVLLVAFDDRARVLQPATSRKDAVLQQLAALRSNGGTALYDAVQTALERLNGLSARKVVVLLTDGSDQNAEGTGPGSRTTLDACLGRAAQRDVSIFTVGLGFHVERKVLARMSEDTGGRSLWAADAAGLRELYDEIARYLRSSYHVTYRTQNPWQDGELRRVRLQVQDGGRFGEGVTTYWTSRTMPRIAPAPPARPTPTPAPVESGWDLRWGRERIADVKPGRAVFMLGGKELDPAAGRIVTHPEGRLPEACLFDGNRVYLPGGRYRFVPSGPGLPAVEAVFDVVPGLERRVELGGGEEP
jgi:VWFA-related protein